MPEMTFTVRWPDGTVDACYSPSLVMHDHLTVGESYTNEEFVARTTTALETASARVKAKYGFACTSALQQQDEIAARSVTFDPHARIEILDMNPSLPPTETSA
jgi:uncharacterized repeat protein (TIGR04042 family)